MCNEMAQKKFPWENINLYKQYSVCQIENFIDKLIKKNNFNMLEWLHENDYPFTENDEEYLTTAGKKSI